MLFMTVPGLSDAIYNKSEMILFQLSDVVHRKTLSIGKGESSACWISISRRLISCPVSQVRCASRDLQHTRFSALVSHYFYCQFCPILRLAFGQNCTDVVLDRTLGQMQLLADLGIALA